MPKVLIVDDDPSILDGLQAFFDPCGFAFEVELRQKQREMCEVAEVQEGMPFFVGNIL